MFRRPTDIRKYRSEHDGFLERFTPISRSLDDLPPDLSNLNPKDTRFVPPVMYFGFEVPNNKLYKLIYPHFKAIRSQFAFGLNGKVVDIIILDTNVRRMKPEPQDAMVEVEKILGHPPKLYLSIEHPCWHRRKHYHYTDESSVVSPLIYADKLFQRTTECDIPCPCASPLSL